MCWYWEQQNEGLFFLLCLQIFNPEYQLVNKTEWRRFKQRYNVGQQFIAHPEEDEGFPHLRPSQEVLGGRCGGWGRHRHVYFTLKATSKTSHAWLQHVAWFCISPSVWQWLEKRHLTHVLYKAEAWGPSHSSSVSCFAFPGDDGAPFSHTGRYLGGFTVGFVEAEETELK